MHDDSYMKEMVDGGKVRPKRGHLIGQKLVWGKSVRIDGFGEVSGDTTASGLVVVSNKTTEDEAVKQKLVVVEALGNPPPEWKFRFFGRERNWKTDWAGQGIEQGVVVALRACAGVEQDPRDRYLDVRYDEIVAIGQMEGDEPMLPAPGWVLLDVSYAAKERASGLVFRPELDDVLENNKIQYGVVKALPAGYTDGDVKVGDRVGFRRYNNEEFLSLEGNIEARLLDELVVVCS